MNKSLLFLMSLFALGTAVAQTPCESGLADGYPCENIDLMSFLSIDEVGGAQNLNDIWGWTDPEDGSEYVVLGKDNGTAFVDISDPLNPVYLGTLPTHTMPSLWRDVKVYNNHAFIVSEAFQHGMQVFDLTQLRDVENPPVDFETTVHYSLFGNAHNIVINEETGFAYAVGTSTFNGGLHIIDISDPTSPVLAGSFAEDDYTHDAQAVVYTGPDQDYTGREIVFACNEDTFTIVDVEDKQDCQEVAREGYEGNGYAHQGWATEDQRYFLLDDETDETNFDHNTKTYVWDIQDLDNPVMVGFFLGSTTASDHNLYIKGNYVYQSNYHAGLRILEMVDLSNAELEEIAYFDVDPNTNQNGFNGSWSNYPYFESGVIALTGMTQGLFMVKPQDGIISSVDNITQAEKSSVMLYPNPASEMINIRFEGYAEKSVNIEIIDLSGRVILAHTNIPLITNSLQIDLGVLSTGVYAIRFPGSHFEAQHFVVN